MRLKIPAPVQTWFNALSTSNKRRQLTEDEPNTTSTTHASLAVATPLVLEALHNLCYEIFALPVCTADAVNIAQTICGHIYDLAQSGDPSLHLLVLDLLPTLVHVYLVLSTTISGGIGNFKATYRPSHKSHSKHKHPFVANYSAATAHTTEMPISAAPTGFRSHMSFRDRLKKSSTVSMDGLRLSKSMRQRTQRLLKGLHPDAFNNASNRNESSPHQKHQQQHLDSHDSFHTARPTVHHLASLEYKKYVETIGTYMTNLTAVLGALLVGLYNTFAKNLVAAPSIYSALPPFANGSVFCGPLNVRGRREEQDGEIVEGLLQLFSNRDPASLLIGANKDATKRSFVVAGEEMELTPCNRWRILRLLCRLCSERVGDLTERGRVALCYLALLLGPSGLRDHRLPPSWDSFGASRETLRGHHRGGHKPRWRGFTENQQKHRHGQGEAWMRTSTPVSGSSPHRHNHKHGVGGGIDLMKITAPLKKVELSVGGSKMKPPEVNIIGPPDNSITGLDNATTAAELRSEEVYDDDSRVVDELLLLGLEDEENVAGVEAASRSPTASPPVLKSAGSSCASSNSDADSIGVSEDNDVVCSSSASAASYSPSSGCSSSSKDETDLGVAFGALNVVKEEEEAVREDEEGAAEMDQLCEPSVDKNVHQKANDKNIVSGLENIQKTKHATHAPDESRAIPGRKISVVNDVNEESSSENSLNEKSPIPLQEEASETTRRDKSGERDKHKKSRQKHFYLGVGGGNKSTGAVGVTVASARIPQLPPYLVLELLPGLHFILSTVHSHLAAEAIHALNQRANLELWSNVLLYTNSIRNSKLYHDAIDTNRISRLNGNGPGHMESLIDQSHSIFGGRALSPSGSVISSGSSHASSTLLRPDREEELADSRQATENSALNRSHRKTPITNASFQVVRPEEDIPLVVDKPGHIKCTSLSAEIDRRQRPKSYSPRHQSITTATSSPMDHVTEASPGFHGLHCGGGLCAPRKISRRHRTLSFNPRLSSTLKTERPKSPTNHEVTFVEEAGEKKEDNQTDVTSEPPNSV